MRSVDYPSSAGQKFIVFDESNVKQKGATLWLAGHEYKANDKGRDSGSVFHFAGQSADCAVRGAGWFRWIALISPGRGVQVAGGNLC